MALATRDEILTEVAKLGMLFPEWEDFTVEQNALLGDMWLEDFSNYPIAALREACRRWRNTDARRPPTPGQLKALVADDLRAMSNLIDRAKRVCEQST